jgi:guanyl-specific ribonuclease Sa
MIYDHGPPVSSRSADSNGRVIVYTFADGSSYMEPVEPPSEQHINSAAVMVPGGIALSRGKGLAGAARAIAAEAIDDAATSRASQAANVVTGGYLGWIPAPIASILFGGKPKPRVTGIVDDAAEAAKDAGTAAAKVTDDGVDAVGKAGGNVANHGPRVGGALELADDVAAEVEDAITRASRGQVRFQGHDGKPYLNRDGLLPARSDYTEWTAAPSGAKRGAHRIIIAGDPTSPDAIYYWDHVNPPVQIWP